MLILMLISMLIKVKNGNFEAESVIFGSKMVVFIQNGVFETKTVISRPQLLIFRQNLPISSPKTLILMLIKAKNGNFEAKKCDFWIKIGQSPKPFFDIEIKMNSS